MAEEPKDVDLAGSGADFDPDEDLFNFDEVMAEDETHGEDDIDLDEIFAAFEEAEEAKNAPPELEPLPPGAVDPAQVEDPQPAQSQAPEAPAPEPTPQATAKPQAPAAPQPAPARATPAPAPVPAAAPAPAPRAPEPGPSVAAPEEADTEVRPIVLASGAHPSFARTVVVILVAMTLLNVSVGLMTFRNASDMRATIDDATRNISETALDMRDHVTDQARVVQTSYSPVVPLTPERHGALDRVQAALDSGDYAMARKRLYALLAIADRLPDDTRADIEARASFLLARSYHAEALDGEERP